MGAEERGSGGECTAAPQYLCSSAQEGGWGDGEQGSRGAGERRREGDEVTRRKGNKKSGERLYQGARSQAHIHGVATVEAPDHSIRHLQASIGQWQVKQQVAIFLRP
jgi:hypothetical protein